MGRGTQETEGLKCKFHIFSAMRECVDKAGESLGKGYGGWGGASQATVSPCQASRVMQVGTAARGWQASQHSHTEGLGPELLRLSTCSCNRRGVSGRAHASSTGWIPGRLKPVPCPDPTHLPITLHRPSAFFMQKQAHVTVYSHSLAILNTSCALLFLLNAVPWSAGCTSPKLLGEPPSHCLSAPCNAPFVLDVPSGKSFY